MCRNIRTLHNFEPSATDDEVRAAGAPVRPQAERQLQAVARQRGRMAVCSRSGLPLAWEVATARESDQAHAAPLLDSLIARGLSPETAAMDSGYDVGPVYDAFEAKGCRPIVKLRQTPAVKRGDHKPPTCQHGEWRFAGSDAKRGASKWRCSTGDCKPASRWIKADRLHPLVPRETPRWGEALRGPRLRGA